MSIWSDPLWLATQGGGGGGGVTPAQLEEALRVKADKAVGATAGNLVALDENGNIADSGYSAADFGSSKELALLLKLTRGTVWDMETDSTEAYAKTVPSGAVAAEIGSIGGKSIMWNQLNRNNGSSGSAGGVSFTKNDDGSWSATGTATGAASKNLASYSSGISGSAGHKYLLYSGLNINAYISADGSIADMSDFYVRDGSKVLTLPSSKDGSKLVLLFRTTDGHAYNTGGYAFFCDLTVMFGAGNEPADNTDPRIPGLVEYAKTHRAFDEGSLLHAAVTSVVSRNGVAATLGTLPIPAAVRSLEGYGQSAVGGTGNVLNLADGTFTEIGHYVGGAWTLLGTPVVTDVSKLLPDNLLDAEAGGTLTFVQAETALPVPNSIDYMTKLS